MSKWLKAFVFFLLSFVLQTTVADWISMFGVSPDFVIIFLVAVAIKRGPASGCFWGFLAGFAQDVYAPVEWLGAHTISMTVVGFLVGQLEERFLSLNFPTKVGVLGLAFFVCDMVYFFITGLENEAVTSLFLTETLPECAYTLFVGALLFYLSMGKPTKHAK